jgi:hypothetical protein
MNLKLINEVATLAKHMQVKYPHLRQGQALMNALHEVDANMYKQIDQTDADCFYQDARIEKFWNIIAHAETQALNQ